MGTRNASKECVLNVGVFKEIASYLARLETFTVNSLCVSSYLVRENDGQLMFNFSSTVMRMKEFLPVWDEESEVAVG